MENGVGTIKTREVELQARGLIWPKSRVPPISRVDLCMDLYFYPPLEFVRCELRSKP